MCMENARNLMYHLVHGGEEQNITESYIVHSIVEHLKGLIKILDLHSVDLGQSI